jgi:nitrate reductase NapD
MNISGVLVHSLPANSKAVKVRLEQFPGVEVHAISEEGRLVVTVEEEASRAMADTVMQFQNVLGVLSAAMVYHHYEEDIDTRLNPLDDSKHQNVSNIESGIAEASK